MSARLLLWKITILPFIVNKYPLGSYSEIIQISCHSSDFYPLVTTFWWFSLASVIMIITAKWLFLVPEFLLHWLIGFILTWKILLLSVYLLIYISTDSWILTLFNSKTVIWLDILVRIYHKNKKNRKKILNSVWWFCCYW